MTKLRGISAVSGYKNIFSEFNYGILCGVNLFSVIVLCCCHMNSGGMLLQAFIRLKLLCQKKSQKYTKKYPDGDVCKRMNSSITFSWLRIHHLYDLCSWTYLPFLVRLNKSTWMSHRKLLLHRMKAVLPSAGLTAPISGLVSAEHPKSPFPSPLLGMSVAGGDIAPAQPEWAWFHFVCCAGQG